VSHQGHYPPTRVQIPELEPDPQLERLTFLERRLGRIEALLTRLVVQPESPRQKRHPVRFLAEWRVCSLCGEEKPISEFTKDAHRPSGRTWHCYPCARTRWATHDRERRLRGMAG
jgi:hypothetical protein